MANAPSSTSNAPNSGVETGETTEWQEKVIQIRRVTKVVKGGKKLSFRAVVIVGNRNGLVGLGVGKANEVIEAIAKAVTAARKKLVTVPLHDNRTIPHSTKARAGSSMLVMRPATKGTGVIAGGAARAVFELAGIEDILSKSLGSRSPLNVAQAAINGLEGMRSFAQIASARGMSVREMLTAQ